MLLLICTPAVAVFLLIFLWSVIREKVSFDYFPLPEYIPKLEYYVFFLPAGLAGWLSILLAHAYLAKNTDVFNLFWPAGLIISFILWEFGGILTIAQAGISNVVAEKSHPRDFIALGIGYLVGVLAGTYQLIVHTQQPPKIIFSPGGEVIKIFFITLASIAFIALFTIIGSYLRKRRKKRRR